MRKYLCDLDPTLNFAGTEPMGVSSYAVNANCFWGRPSIKGSFADGLSNTIGFGEHYTRCLKPVTQFDWLHSYYPETLDHIPGGFVLRRASFAEFPPPGRPYDSLKDDVFLITSGNPPTSVGSIPELTFQVRPRLNEADPRIPQTGHLSGMPALMMDGWVVTLRRGTSPQVFWGLVTPRGGECVELPD